ncbi:MAG: hypothetical protein PHO54_04590 [Candidatus Peribacteraceae bacterium]|nr:hypothetical protein [Candidatus Peribacteraceae bacterium]
MPHFSYSALSPQGELKEGIIDAISLQAARDAIKEMGLNLEEIHESTLTEQTEAGLPPSPPPSEQIASEEPSAVPASPLPNISVAKQEAKQKPKDTDKHYFPLIDTLRLYAGWLLAWYCIVFVLGSYQSSRSLPFRIPYLDGLFLSPLVLSFTLAAFLFLLMTGIWKLLGRGWIMGFLVTILGAAAFVLYRMNVA